MNLITNLMCFAYVCRALNGQHLWLCGLSRHEDVHLNNFPWAEKTVPPGHAPNKPTTVFKSPSIVMLFVRLGNHMKKYCCHKSNVSDSEVLVLYFEELTHQCRFFFSPVYLKLLQVDECWVCIYGICFILSWKKGNGMGGERHSGEGSCNREILCVCLMCICISICVRSFSLTAE